MRGRGKAPRWKVVEGFGAHLAHEVDAEEGEGEHPDARVGEDVFDETIEHAPTAAAAAARDSGGRRISLDIGFGGGFGGGLGGGLLACE